MFVCAARPAFASAVLAFVASAGAIESARVQVTNGVPRIVVDGAPVRARMFWGAQRAGLLPVGPAAGEVAFEFTPAEDEPGHATLHFRFGQAPGEVVLDDISVTDLTEPIDTLPAECFEGGTQAFFRAWSVWPPDARNTVGAVRVEAGRGRDGSGGFGLSLRAPPGDWPDFHIYHQSNLRLLKGHRYRVRFWAHAEPARALTVAFYRPGAHYV